MEDIIELKWQIKRLRLERDHARIMYCDKLSPIDPHKVAEKWGWNCFAHDKETWVEALDRINKLERELVNGED